MAWYIFALVDAPPRVPGGRGFTSPLLLKRLPGCFAVLERRADVPPIEMGALKEHDRIVADVWKKVPAILPVRFGTLLELAELREMLVEREEELADAFAVVRDTAQFSWRSLHESRPAPRPAPGRPASGTDYLRRAARADGGPVPGRYAVVRKALAPLIVRERFQRAIPPRPERLYHLVARRQAGTYASAGRQLVTREMLAFTGPWPPYAFAPVIL